MVDSTGTRTTTSSVIVERHGLRPLRRELGQRRSDAPCDQHLPVLEEQVVMRGVVEQAQPSANRGREVEDGQRGRALVEAIAVAASIKAQQTADQQPVGPLVGDHQHRAVAVRQHDAPDHWQGTREDLDAGLSPRRCHLVCHSKASLYRRPPSVGKHCYNGRAGQRQIRF